ncbi:MAG: peptidylprolyl isomerase [Thermoanaerobaculia bacterium]
MIVRTMFAMTALVAVLACGAPANQEAAADENSSGTATLTEPTASEATASNPTDVATPATAEKKENKPVEKPLSYYEDKVAVLHTTDGDITIRFFPQVAPNHVRNFIDLSERGFYNATKFHRIVPGFMIQGGDPNTVSNDRSAWGTGGSGKNVKAEFNDIPHRRGIVSMARSSNPDSASSQFFICVADARFLDHKYTAFGEVTSGMDVADKIVSGPARNEMALEPVTITSVTVRPATESEKGPLPK